MFKRIIIDFRDTEDYIATKEYLKEIGYVINNAYKVCGDGVCGKFPRYKKD